MTLQDKKTTIISRLSLFSATIFWGSSFVVLKNILDVIPSMYSMAFRYTAGCLFLFIFGFKHFRHIRKIDIIAGVVPGAFMFIGTIFQTFGLVYTTPGKNAFLTGTYCVIVPFLYWIIAKRKPTIYNVIAAILCVIGVGFVSLKDDLSIALGDGLTLCCGFLFAAQIIFIDKYVRKCDLFLITFFQFATCGVAGWISALIIEDFPVNAGWQVVPGFIYVGLFTLALGYMLQMFGQRNTPASATALILSLESVIGVICSMIFYGEHLTVRIAIGFALIFFAIVVSETNLSFLKRNKPNLVTNSSEKVADGPK